MMVGSTACRRSGGPPQARSAPAASGCDGGSDPNGIVCVSWQQVSVEKRQNRGKARFVRCRFCLTDDVLSGFPKLLPVDPLGRIGVVGRQHRRSSIGSILSVGSIGSVLSVGSMISILSNCSILSKLSNCSILSDQSNASILSRRADRSVLDRPFQLGVPGLRRPAQPTSSE